MIIAVKLNPKHESFMITAFLDWLSNSGHELEMIFSEEDVVDDQEPVDLDNVPFQSHYKQFVNSVVYVDGGARKELYKKPVNTP